ncbi:MAG TPA: hypothetical protein DHW14_07260 [Clostridiales bacterium]|nr:hypothetical protein [Clostridiales bacterium]
MTEETLSRRALGYINEVLGKAAHYLDATPTDDGWVVRAVVVETKPKPGPGGGSKEWHVLYEVHLDRDMEPQFHVRRGFWSKPLPGSPRAEPAARGDTSGEVGSCSAESGSAQGQDPEENGGEDRDEDRGEDTTLPEEVLEPTPEASEEGGQDPAGEETGEEVPVDAAEGLEDVTLEPERPPLEAGGEEQEHEEEEESVPEEEPAPGPSRPKVQVRQGAPAVRFRYVQDDAAGRPEAADDAVGEPEPGEPGEPAEEESGSQTPGSGEEG